MTIFQLYNKELGLFMYKYKNGMLPISFDHVFTELGENHNYYTRNKTNFRNEIHKIKSAFTTGPKFWNMLPKSVKNATTLNSLKKAISSFLQNE